MPVPSSVTLSGFGAAAGAADCVSASAFGSVAAGVEASIAMNSRRSTATSYSFGGSSDPEDCSRHFPPGSPAGMDVLDLPRRVRHGDEPTIASPEAVGADFLERRLSVASREEQPAITLHD